MPLVVTIYVKENNTNVHHFRKLQPKTPYLTGGFYALRCKCVIS